ncbi:hypothetical protein Q4488_18675 [Amphritea sp. 1_MG-2023]|uniref:hypothetical protein n=1 Tax=Amphritea sp. 1_MG-2023 TaxID=3062670 RepID=UPI0026E222AA|nr:hypothetical protein [Amphritea sp. 1_MG-2023]MDO6565401.1 hypothetical protein [Amphritea sp. 1_MG-2023]
MIQCKHVITLVVTSVISANTFALDAKFADARWDGKHVPTGQQCLKFGGDNPATPALTVSDLPPGTNVIVLEYSDRDSQKMDNGGHGRMQYTVNTSASQVTIPSVAGHSFDIPAEFKIIEAHRSPGWDKAGAYMPPCSGGKGHAYYVTITALQDDNVSASTLLEMGKY